MGRKLKMSNEDNKMDNPLGKGGFANLEKQMLDSLKNMGNVNEKDVKLEEKEIKKFKETINRIVSTEDGKYFFRTWLKFFIRYGQPKKSLDGRVLLQQMGKDLAYSEAIRPFLTPKNRKEIEHG